METNYSHEEVPAGVTSITPGGMGGRSHIVRGKRNADNSESCSHGAG